MSRIRAGDQILVHITDLFSSKGGFDPSFWAIVVSKADNQRNWRHLVIDRMHNGVLPTGWATGMEIQLHRYRGKSRIAYGDQKNLIVVELLEHRPREPQDPDLILEVIADQAMSGRRIDGSCIPVRIEIRDYDVLGRPRTRQTLVDHTGLVNGRDE